MGEGHVGKHRLEIKHRHRYLLRFPKSFNFKILSYLGQNIFGAKLILKATPFPISSQLSVYKFNSNLPLKN